MQTFKQLLWADDMAWFINNEMKTNFTWKRTKIKRLGQSVNFVN